MSRWRKTGSEMSYEGRGTVVDSLTLKTIFCELLEGRPDRQIRKKHGLKVAVLRDLKTKFHEWLMEDSNAR